MKKTKTNAIAKKAKKAAKKDLTAKIADQIKFILSDFGPGLKKAEKSIEKAAKNLAKKLSKLTKEKAAKLAPEDKAVGVSIVKSKPSAIETAPINTAPAKSAPAVIEVKTPKVAVKTAPVNTMPPAKTTKK